MNKYTIGIDGMRCGMCEIHVKNVAMKAIKAKTIKASHLKNTLTIISEEEITREDLEKIYEPTGYRVVSYKKEKAVRKLFGWR